MAALVDQHRADPHPIPSRQHLVQEFDSNPAEPLPDWDPNTPPAGLSEPGHGEVFGVVTIPSSGSDYQRPATQGTSSDVLDSLGLGHYEGSAMPGQVGNFSLAGHRQTRGKVLNDIDLLTEGDHIYVRTKDGYYTYTVYSHEIVQPDQVEVIEPVPGQPGVAPTERLLTLTTCPRATATPNDTLSTPASDPGGPPQPERPQKLPPPVAGS